MKGERLSDGHGRFFTCLPCVAFATANAVCKAGRARRVERAADRADGIAPFEGKQAAAEVSRGRKTKKHQICLEDSERNLGTKYCFAKKQTCVRAQLVREILRRTQVMGILRSMMK